MLATMAVDRWVPQRFARFSDRLVIQDGVILMGGAAIVFLLVTRAQVKLLVIFYAINVFITFVVSLLGMCVHWYKVRAAEPRWRRRFALCATGLAICVTILAARPLIGEGMEGWFGASGRSSFGTDPVDELVELCPKVMAEYPRAVFFAGHLVFPQETYWTRILHSQTAYELQRRLQFQGVPMVVLPIRVYGPAGAPPPSVASPAP